MTQNKKIRIALNSSSVLGSYLNYDQDVGIVPPTFNWALNTTYCFKVEWVGHDIAVYHRKHSDPNNGSNDVLLHQTTGNWANRYNSLTNPPKVGFYLDGTAVRMYDYHIWQGPH
jgi:hypothetical protein